jgi:hypothetical protein
MKTDHCVQNFWPGAMINPHPEHSGPPAHNTGSKTQSSVRKCICGMQVAEPSTLIALGCGFEGGAHAGTHTPTRGEEGTARLSARAKDMREGNDQR